MYYLNDDIYVCYWKTFGKHYIVLLLQNANFGLVFMYICLTQIVHNLVLEDRITIIA
jgi:hypothetical protein